MDWLTRWRLRQYVARSIWMIPAAFAFTGLAAGVLLTRVDRGADAIAIEFGASAARNVLAAIGGGMITLTGFVFAILLLLVQFGTGRFSPRLLDWFLRRKGPKIALGTFMATFLYALVVLRVVGTDADPDRVPSNAVAVAILLTLVSGAVFLVLVHRSTVGLRVGSVLRLLTRRAAAVIDAAYPPGAARAPTDGEPARPVPASIVRYEGDGGLVQAVDAGGLAHAAARARGVIELVPPIGGWLAPGAPLLVVHGAGRIDERRLRRSIAVGNERILAEDPAFAFRALADIATRARPRASDPTTTIQALDQIERLLLRMAPRLPLGDRIVRDREGTVRVVQPAPSWEDYLSLALDEIRHVGAGSPQVSRRLRSLLDDLLAAVPPGYAEPLRERLDLLDAAASRDFDAGHARQRASARDRQGLGLSRGGAG